MGKFLPSFVGLFADQFTAPQIKIIAPLPAEDGRLVLAGQALSEAHGSRMERLLSQHWLVFGLPNSMLSGPAKQHLKRAVQSRLPPAIIYTSLT
jgi:hypothetical protein